MPPSLAPDSPPPAGTDSRRTGAAWAGLCGLGHGMDFGVGALILVVVVMISPPKSEKLKAPHRGDATAAGTCRQAQPSFPAAATISMFRSPGVPDRPGQEILRLAGREPLPAADVDDVRPRLDRLVDGTGEIQLRKVPLLIGEDRDDQPATPRRQPGDRAVVAPRRSHWPRGCRAGSSPRRSPGRWPGWRVASGPPPQSRDGPGRPVRRAPPRKRPDPPPACAAGDPRCPGWP